jgi:hypothetical protein
MAMSLVVGTKPVRAVGDWGLAMNQVQTVVSMCASSLACHYVLIGHVEKETDETTGAQLQMLSTLGRKLAPTLPRYFSDVLLTRNVQGKFFWASLYPGVDVKGRHCPLSDSLPADFGPLLDVWREKTGTLPVSV